MSPQVLWRPGSLEPGPIHPLRWNGEPFVHLHLQHARPLGRIQGLERWTAGNIGNPNCLVVSSILFMKILKPTCLGDKAFYLRCLQSHVWPNSPMDFPPVLKTWARQAWWFDHWKLQEFHRVFFSKCRPNKLWACESIVLKAMLYLSFVWIISACSIVKRQKPLKHIETIILSDYLLDVLWSSPNPEPHRAEDHLHCSLR